jgi:AcrR family transcriptional regulator
MKVGRRPYELKTRATAAAATAERILDAATAVFWEVPSDQISLDEVASRADVSVQTVIRRFGGKHALLAAAAQRESARVADLRDAAPVGDAPAAVRILVDHYELTGDRVMKMLAEEQRVPGLAEIVDLGREMHRRWCSRVFAPALARCEGHRRDRMLAQLIAVCDVYTWKLLRRDSGLSRSETELAILELLNPMLKEV